MFEPLVKVKTQAFTLHSPGTGSASDEGKTDESDELVLDDGYG